MKVAINDTRALSMFINEGGFVDAVVKKLKNTFPYRFELPGRLSTATWTMWKMMASGQIHGKWTYTAASDDSFIAFYFQSETDCAYARLIAGNDDCPNDGWVPQEILDSLHD